MEAFSPPPNNPGAGQIQACLGRLVGLVGSGAREDQAELLLTAGLAPEVDTIR